ncbi:thioredoxin-dependent thiol peroxidase [Nitratireductor sp. CH_MIT9313-5]|jgi:peroxiredoxin Q/BCP|uniref:thioredoxin-dependent thiol peroxidase n=1 Tax=Nitratireductor sp. CH_MIT9313-5 TaxID=3107764 RepID=UPI00300B6B7F
MAGPDIGSPAPDFELTADGGDIVKLSDFRGKPVVLYFYPKDDTSGCTAQAIAFTERLSEFEALGAVVLGMSPDSQQKHAKFKAKHDLKITLLSDPEKEVLETYGVWVEKSMYGRKYMGVERSTFLLDEEGKVAHAWRKVKVPGHADAVLERLREMTAGE